MSEGHPSKIDRSVSVASLSGALTIVVGLGIIFIAVREFLDPNAGARGFGVPLLNASDGDLLAIKAARDSVSGVLVLTFLALQERAFLTYAMGVLTFIPVLDGLIVLRHAHWIFTPVILIHWGTAALMLGIVALLRRGR